MLQENIQKRNIQNRINTSIALAVLISALTLVGTVLANDKNSNDKSPSLFESLAEQYNSNPQTVIEFKHIVVSDFFGTADTIDGTITFAADGRYRTKLGEDEFLFDGQCLWEYSAIYAQASRNCLKPGQRLDDSFLFFRHFHDYYTVRTTLPDSIYQLSILKEYQGKAPDSLTVTLSPQKKRIVAMEYFDINDEINRILIGSESKSQTVDSLLYQPTFPDSTEIIEIPG